MHRDERQQQEQRAQQIDHRLGARRRIGIENVDPHMAADLQRPGRRQQEQGGVGVDHRFGQPDRADAEDVAQQHHRELHQHDREREPRRGAADGRVQAVDPIGNAGGVRSSAGELLVRSPAGRILDHPLSRTVAQCTDVSTEGSHGRTRSRPRIITTHHDHDHDHEHGSELSETQLRVRALETILTEKGYVDPKALDAIIEAYETRIGPHNGARAVAKAWADPDYKQALLADATKAVGSLGFASRVGDHLVAVENTPKLHNMIVCTLCSCYPWEVLGLPPVWYKSAPYRSRTVIDPRGVLKDFGVTLPDGHRNPRLGLDRRDPLHRAADAAGRHRRLERGQARRAGHPRLHDRHRPAEDAGRRVMTATADIAAFLDAQMADAETQWSLGTFGAIAEFARDAGRAGHALCAPLVGGDGARRRPDRAAARTCGRSRSRPPRRTAGTIASRSACPKTTAPCTGARC